MNIKSLIFLGLLVSRQVFCAPCDFRVTNAKIFSTQKNYKIKISFKQACSKNSFYKRSLVSPKFELFKEDKLLTSLQFAKGYWLESSQKYHLVELTSAAPKCPKMGNITLDLENDFITSLSGNYLNLKKETLAKWPCAF